MARIWVPEANQPIGATEPIGRRLFETPRLAGDILRGRADGWKDVLITDHFLESRDPGEVSLDRLGRFGVDPLVRDVLRPIAEDMFASRTPPRKFVGWVWLKADKLRSPGKGASAYDPLPSPVHADELHKIKENAHHAHVCRRPGDTAWITAVALRALFERHGSLDRVSEKRSRLWIYSRWIFAVCGRIRTYFVDRSARR